MRTIKMAMTLSAFGWAAGGAVAQVPAGDDAWVGGIWPTPRMAEMMLRRMASDLRDQYELDDPQARRVEDMMLKRWMSFMSDHRATLQPVLNRFFERQLSPTPPDPEEVKSWASDVRPLFDELLKEVRAGQVEMRNVLRPKQKMKFDADMFKFTLGVQLVEQRLQSWERGEVKDTTLWSRPSGGLPFARSTPPGGPQSSTKQEPADRSPDRPSIHAWEAFVQRFIRQHQLDESQVTTALAILTELRDRATTYEQRTAEQRELLRRRLTELEAPVDKMFAELQTRLETLVVQP